MLLHAAGDHLRRQEPLGAATTQLAAGHGPHGNQGNDLSQHFLLAEEVAKHVCKWPYKRESGAHNIAVSRSSLALFKETLYLLRQLFCNQLGVTRRAKVNFPKQF